MFVIAGCPQGESWLYITNLSQIALLDVSSDEAAKVYIWTISVRLAGLLRRRINLRRKHSKPPVYSVYTNGLDDAWAGFSAGEPSIFLPRFTAVLRPTCFAKHLNEKPQIIALLISFFPLLCIPPMVNKMLLNHLFC